MGKVDMFRKKEKILIERKYQLKQIFQGQISNFQGRIVLSYLMYLRSA